MRPFTRERNSPVFCVERDSKGYEVNYTFRAFFAEDAYGVWVAETGAGRERVLVVQIGGVLVTNCGCNAALGPTGVTVLKRRFCKNQDAAVFLGE